MPRVVVFVNKSVVLFRAFLSTKNTRLQQFCLVVRSTGRQAVAGLVSQQKCRHPYFHSECPVNASATGAAVMQRT